MNITIYQGAALATYEKIQEGHADVYINKVYQSKTAKCLFYINSKGYLHILQATKENLSGRTTGYFLTDSILTKNNLIEYKKDYTKKYKSIEGLQDAILKMIA